VAHDAHGSGEEHGLQVRQYVQIGVLLTVITVIELALSYTDLGGLLVPLLLALSAVKFAIVVAFFMHLKFDHPLLTRMFVGPLILATLVLLALVTLGAYDISI
jgi:cytochrome c oxidase subunit 4